MVVLIYNSVTTYDVEYPLIYVYFLIVFFCCCCGLWTANLPDFNSIPCFLIVEIYNFLHVLDPEPLLKVVYEVYAPNLWLDF